MSPSESVWTISAVATLLSLLCFIADALGGVLQLAVSQTHQRCSAWCFSINVIGPDRRTLSDDARVMQEKHLCERICVCVCACVDSDSDLNADSDQKVSTRPGPHQRWSACCNHCRRARRCSSARCLAKTPTLLSLVFSQSM